MSAPQPGDLLLYRDHDLVGWAIRVCSASPANHAAIVDERGTGAIAATRRGIVRGPLPALDADHWLYPFPGGDRAAVLRYAVARLGQPYGWADYPGMIRRLLHLTVRHARPKQAYREALVCSTLALAAWRAAGVDPCPDLPLTLCTPGDLFCALARQASADVRPPPLASWLRARRAGAEGGCAA